MRIANKYTVGGVTGFAAAGYAYAADGRIQGTLAAANIVCLAALWYYTGRGERK